MKLLRKDYMMVIKLLLAPSASFSFIDLLYGISVLRPKMISRTGTKKRLLQLTSQLNWISLTECMKNSSKIERQEVPEP